VTGGGMTGRVATLYPVAIPPCGSNSRRILASAGDDRSGCTPIATVSPRVRGGRGRMGAMCGRYVVTKAVNDLLPDLLGGFDPLPDDFNVAPTALVPVVRERGGERRMPEVQWGFLPSWAKDLKAKPQPINARIETVATSGM